MQNHVRFDDSYFKKTINEYQDWQFAFFRETAQNGCDAKARNIFYHINEKEDYIEVVCEDDGKGMTEDILLTKFLVMGGSHKESGSVGGFGYAKSIILFCHPFYEIRTNDSVLTGSYGRYYDPVVEVNAQKGTKITVHIDKESCSIYNLKSKLREWVNNSTLKNTKVFLNDEELEQQSLRSLKYKNETNIGKLMFSKETSEYSYSSTLWVRMRGMAMFKKNIYSNNNHFVGAIDLDAESSQTCLTANRDGLKPEYDNSLNSLIQQLSEEMSSYQLDDMEGFKINEMKKRFEEEAIPFSNDSMFENTDNIFKTEEDSHKERLRKRRIEKAALVMGQTEVNKILEKERHIKKDLDDKIADIIKKIDTHKYPDNFAIMINNLKEKTNREILKEYNQSVKFLNQSRIQKNSEFWIKLVKAVMDVSINKGLIPIKKSNDDYFLFDKPINFGAILSKETTVLGCCEENSEEYVISFNPLKFKGSEYSKFDLLQVAAHEVTHLLYKEHNEHFSYFNFSLIKAMNDSKLNVNKL